jgi:hypothetical protein
MHIRKDFGKLANGNRQYFARQCFNKLHPLALGFSEPAIFKKHFYDCLEKISKLMPLAFVRFLAISRAQDGTFRPTGPAGGNLCLAAHCEILRPESKALREILSGEIQGCPQVKRGGARLAQKCRGSAGEFSISEIAYDTYHGFHSKVTKLRKRNQRTPLHDRRKNDSLPNAGGSS